MDNPTTALVLGDILHREDPSAPAVLFDNEVYSYADLERLSNKFGHGFRSLGLERGDRVSFLLGNDPLMVAAYFGAFKAGVVANPLGERLAAEEIAYIVDHAGSTVVVVSEHHAALLAEALDGLARPIRVVCFGDPGGLRAEPSTFFDCQPGTVLDGPAPGGTDGALLLYTSGTTGRPKGVLLTHRNVTSGVEAVAAAFELKPGNRTLCFMPLSHTNALMFSTLPFLLAGATTVLCRRFSASKFWDWCRDYEVDSTSVSPTILSILLENAPPERPRDLNLKLVKVASAPTSVDLAQRFEQAFGKGLLLETYGLTETTSINAWNPLHGPRKFGSIGKALPPHEIRIVDERGVEVPRGGVGEIAIRGPTVMSGYFRDPQATSATIRDGWARAGDLARMDEDGYIFIVGRKKELIIRGGENVSPLEVEQVISKHPAVREAAAVGIPDRIWGETVAACVVRRDAVTERELLEFCAQHLAKFKIPEKIAFVEELPRNGIGKLVRRGLLRYFEPAETGS